MCYSLSSRLWKDYKLAERGGASPAELEDLYRIWLEQYEAEQADKEANPDKYKDRIEHYHVSGFEHPKLMALTNDPKNFISEMEWGFVPFWVKDQQSAVKMRNQCLNARSETIFEKPAFRESIKHRRCVIPIDSYFEYHHIGRSKYPFRVINKDGRPLLLAGIWDECEAWYDESSGEILKTFSIVTTEGNEMLSKVHNNPKQIGSRMPLVLSQESALTWLRGDKKDLENIMHPLEEGILEAYPVPPLIGKAGVGDRHEAHQFYDYLDIELQMLLSDINE